MITNLNHCNLDVLHENCEKPRAYFIPYNSPETAATMTRENSKRFMKLSGEWAFAYYNNLDEVPDSAVKTQTAITSWNKIPVPSNWQMHGYDKPQYLNTRYPFPIDPPHISCENPVGVYARDFIVSDEWDGLDKYIVFEGVDSAFYVYINGEYVGYSQVSHMTSEMNISQKLKSGTNRIAVVVMKWCDGSYLECQDKWRMSGIFRDVYILARTKGHLENYSVKTELDDDLRNARVSFKLDMLNPEDAVIKLTSPEGEIVAELHPDENGNADCSVSSPSLWSAETPELYYAEISAAGEYIPEKIGIRSAGIEGAVFRVNGRAVKLKGVNRHDFDPYGGYVCTTETMITDIKLMKQHNVNAVRTSHYPNDPRFLQLCDKFGLYVLDEADIETHGVWEMGNGDYLSDNPDWTDAYIDRVSRMVERDKNRPCVIGWSMGNESGYGMNIVAGINYCKEKDPSRFTHYEGFKEIDSYKFSPEPDVVSRMYPGVQWCLEYCENQNDPRPLMLCEYSHAMGNGPGDLQDYWDVINTHPNFIGAFVWEWYNHGLYAGKTPDGREKFCYGGDFGEKDHDGEFCCDGLIMPDKTATPGLEELKYVTQPVKVEPIDVMNGEYIVHNLYDFIYLSRFECSYEIIRNGALYDSGVVGSFVIPPQKAQEIKADYNCPTDGECYVRLIFRQLGGDSSVESGTPMAFAQFELPTKLSETAAPSENGIISANESRRAVKITGDGFSYTFDKTKGTFSRIEAGGKNLLLSPMEYSVWRAPIDNERNIKNKWYEMGFDRLQTHVYDCNCSHSEHGVEINVDFAMCSPTKPVRLRGTACYSVSGSGEIDSVVTMNVDENVPWIQRFGFNFSMDSSFDNLSYYGYGPFDSYIDRHNASYIGTFVGKVSAQMTDYIRPQACGNHYKTRYAAVTDQTGDGLIFANIGGFDFTALPYSQAELDKAAHNYELPKSSKTCICADYLQSGVGSNSCGPELLEQYRLRDKEITFKLRICPVNAADKDYFAKAHESI